MFENKTLTLCVDMYGCPNRCRHCWLGHMPNRRMEDGADEFIVSRFEPYFGRIEFYSWLREPDYCDDYRGRWEKDIALSKNMKPERFELASFYRIVRDKDYIPFLREVGTKKVQLTLFGLEATTDRYVGRPGAYRELMAATDALIDGGIVPRWQCFINEENKDEIPLLLEMAEKLRSERCPEMEFFVHEGTCDGENRKLYPIRIRKSSIPEVLIPVYLNYSELLEERECVEILKNDHTHPDHAIGDEIVIYVSNTFDLYYNFTNMTPEWVIGNLKEEEPAELVRRITEGDTPALRRAKETTWAELAERFGDPKSERAFELGDYRDYLFNEYLRRG